MSINAQAAMVGQLLTDGTALYRVHARGPMWADVENVLEPVLRRVQWWELAGPKWRLVRPCSDEEARDWWEATKEKAV